MSGVFNWPRPPAKTIDDLPNEILDRILIESENLNSRLVCHKWNNAMVRHRLNEKKWDRCKLKTYIHTVPPQLEVPRREGATFCVLLYPPVLLISPFLFDLLGQYLPVPNSTILLLHIGSLLLGAPICVIIPLCILGAAKQRARNVGWKLRSALKAVRQERVVFEERRAVERLGELVHQWPY